ncbi:MAG: c-type cytochrome [Deltaproteobacteria bacterium]|nr:c-type cytochrome [Deltaproteobacteria bacterium]
MKAAAFVLMLVPVAFVSACKTPYYGPLTPRPIEECFDCGGGFFNEGSPAGPQPAFGTTVQALETPPPISGGTLTILKDDNTAIASDQDRDRIYVVDLRSKSLISDIILQAHDEPGRVVEDADHRVHVVLRGGGAVLTLAGAPWTSSVRRSVCALPRGIAYDKTGDQLHVACANGELVSMPSASGAPTRTVQLPDDLRDVAVVKGKLMVTRLRSAEILTLDANGKVSATKRPPEFLSRSVFSAGAAMRLATDSTGDSAFLLHQRGTEEPVVTQAAGGYGGPDICSDPIVHTTVSEVEPGQTPVESPVIAEAVVPVDIAVAAFASKVAIVAPGNAFTKGSPTVFVMNATTAARTSPPAPQQDTSFGSPSGNTCQFPSESVEVPGQAVAAGFDSTGKLFVQTREPAALFKITNGTPSQVLVLSTESRFDTGHAVFHSNAGGSVACASCHLEGGDDGRVWSFATIGARRTQSLRGGVAGTEPFHWDGDQADFTALTQEVFQHRMGGPRLTEPEITATARWVNAIPANQLRPVKDAVAVTRGQKLFEGSAQCTSCHNGASFTNSATADVGTGGKFQTPSLRGVAWRAPFLHDGAAPTLEARFGQFGGGDKHGKTSHLSATDVKDLVAYMESL